MPARHLAHGQLNHLDIVVSMKLKKYQQTVLAAFCLFKFPLVLCNTRLARGISLGPSGWGKTQN